MRAGKKQTELAKKILETEDKNVLKYIQAILDNNSESWEEEMPEYVKKSIDEGMKDIKEGRVTPHEQVMKKYKKWLKK